MLSFEHSFNSRDYYGKYFKAVLSSDKTIAQGGWRTDPNAKRIWRTDFETEISCCGFPIMSEIRETAEAKKYFKEIAAELSKVLNKHCVYLAAYIPETKMYEGTRLILKEAGFIPTVKLLSRHGKGRYHNVRWEWNLGANLITSKGKKNEKAVRTFNI